MNVFTRRDFIKLTGCTIASGGLILLSPPAEAVLPLVLRFIFGMGVRTTVRRVPTRVLVGSATGKSYKSVVSLGLTASVAFSVSPNVYAQAREYNAEAIWVNSGVKNNFQLAMQNNSNERKQAQLSYILRDVPSNRIELERNCGVLSVGPNDSFSFPFEISELPYVGVKKLEAISDSPGLHRTSSGNIIIADSKEVKFDDD